MYQEQSDNLVTIMNSDSERASQPREITTPMKPHQLTMLNACLNIENDNIRYSKRTC